MPRLFLIVLLLAGCKDMPSLQPYRIDVQQGNYVTQEMVAKLKPGMTRAQVRYALGAPLIVDPFHSDRWDYVYVYQKAGKITEQRRMVVIFVDDKLVRVEGDVVPRPEPAAKPAVKPAEKPPAPAPAKPDAAAGAAAAKPDATPAPRPGAAATSKPEPAGLAAGAPAAETARREPAKTDATKTDAAKSDAAKTKPKPPEEKGFFGRMLEKIGF